MTGFEPATSSSRTPRRSRLYRYLRWPGRIWMKLHLLDSAVVAVLRCCTYLLIRSPGRGCWRVQDGLSTAGSGPLRPSPARGIVAGLLSGLLSTQRLPDLCLIRWARFARWARSSPWTRTGSSMTVCGEVRPIAPRLAPSMGVSQRRHHVATTSPSPCRPVSVRRPLATASLDPRRDQRGRQDREQGRAARGRP